LRRKQIIAQGMTSQDYRSGRKRGRGQPTKFREEYVEQVRALCEAGVRDEEIAANLGVSSRSLHRWQDRWPQFFEARELKHQPALRQFRKRQHPHGGD
jgi:DNA invertase Pin-like site-specific DNA recombinase